MKIAPIGTLIALLGLTLSNTTHAEIGDQFPTSKQGSTAYTFLELDKMKRDHQKRIIVDAVEELRRFLAKDYATHNAEIILDVTAKLWVTFETQRFDSLYNTVINNIVLQLHYPTEDQVGAIYLALAKDVVDIDDSIYTLDAFLNLKAREYKAAIADFRQSAERRPDLTSDEVEEALAPLRNLHDRIYFLRYDYTPDDRSLHLIYAYIGDLTVAEGDTILQLAEKRLKETSLRGDLYRVNITVHPARDKTHTTPTLKYDWRRDGLDTYNGVSVPTTP